MRAKISPRTGGVPSTLRRHAKTLDHLRTSNGTVQKAIINTANKALLNALVSLAGNILEGTVKLTPSQQSGLSRYANAIRELVHGEDKSLKTRKKILTRHTNQKGGFLSLLIKPIAKLLGGIFGGAAD